MSSNCRLLVGSDNAIVRFGVVLVSADLGVFAFLLVHECLEFGVTVLGDGLGGHLDDAAAASVLNVGRNVLDGLFENVDANVLVQGLRGQDVEGWGDELDLDLGVVGVLCLCATEGVLDGVDTVVAEARHLDVCADLCGLRSETLADVGCELVLDDVVGELDLIPDVGVCDGKFEGVHCVAILLVEWPADALIEFFDGGVGLLGDVAHDGVDHL